MVSFLGSTVVSLLVVSAAAGDHHARLHREYKRNYPVSSPPPSSVPSAATTSSVPTYSHLPYNTSSVVSVPAGASSSSYSVSVPAGESSSVPSVGESSSEVKSYPTTSTEIVTSTVFSTVTVEPIGGESSPAAGSGGSGSGGAGNGGHGAGSGESSAVNYCAPVTVTVTGGQPPASSAPAVQESSTPKSPAAEKPSTSEKSYPTSAPAQGGAFQEKKTTKTSAAAAESSVSAYPTAKPSKTSSGSGSGSGSGGKRGVAYATLSTLSSQATGINWAWNWAPSASGLPDNIEYVPIMNNMQQTEQFAAAASELASSGKAGHLMYVNEPDMTTGGGGSCLSPDEAAQGYQDHMMPFAGGNLRLGSPSVTSDNSTSSYLNGKSPSSGLAYLADFKKACGGCQIDFVNLHWYGSEGQSGEDQASAFKDYIGSATEYVKALFGGDTNVWITEFSALPTADKDSSGVNAAFIQSVVPWLESQPAVERYSYFAATPGLLCNADGSLNDLGAKYVSA